MLYEDDRAPKQIQFPIKLGDVVGADVDRVVVVLRKPSGTAVDWTLTLLTLTATHWTGVYTLAADGTSLGAAGTFFCQAFLYDASDVLLGETSETGFTVAKSIVRRPL